MKENNVIIIGAGISGLTAGVYAKKSGFNVTILEHHIIPGGLSTSWIRKGYLFEGGMHWLTGSLETLSINKVWKEVGALQENNPIYNKDPIYTLLDNGQEINLYRDIDKFKEELLRVAPEDKKAINRLYKDVKSFLGVHIVIDDIPGLKSDEPKHPDFKELMGMMPVMKRIIPLNNTPYEKYIQMFKNKNVQHLLRSLIGERYNALSFIYTLASFASGDCGYPKGGSLVMAKNIASKFESLGGKIEYRKTVEKIVIENGKTKGVIANGEFIPADAVIVTQDTRKAIDTLFEQPLKEKWINQMRKKVISEQNMFLAFGVKADLSKYPRGIIYPLNETFKAAGLEFKELRINNYALYEGYAPEGCSSVTCLLLGPSYRYWKAAKEDGSYKQKKQEIMDSLIKILESFMPEIKGNIEITDVATPLTYERFCNTYEGSWMSVWEPKMITFNFPPKAKTVDGLYFASQRSSMPGGLPIAVYAGRKAVEYLCKTNNVTFINKELKHEI